MTCRRADRGGEGGGGTCQKNYGEVLMDTRTFMIFRCDGGEWTLPESQVRAWREIYIGIHVDHEIGKAWAWLEANPARRKTPRGMARFLVGWLNRVAPLSVVTEQTPDMYGHWPRCRTWAECTAKALAGARARREA